MILKRYKIKKLYSSLGKSQRYTAFTLVEMLLVLGIVGIMASMTIPGLIQSTKGAEYKAAKDKVRMSIAEAGKILSISDKMSLASSAEDFVKNHLSKSLNIIKYCAPTELEECGIPSGNPTTFKNLYNANVASMPTTWTAITHPFGVTAPPSGDGSGTYSTSNPTTQNFNDSYAFVTADGIAINLFYNPRCVYSHSERPYYQQSSETYTSEKRQLSLDTACIAGVYDMNGLKKPNQVGSDIGFFASFYNGLLATSAAALPSQEGIDTHSKNWEDAYSYCDGMKGYKLPTLDELSALYLGRNITGMPNGVWLWSSSALPGSSESARSVNFGRGGRSWGSRSTQTAVRCVRD